MPGKSKQARAREFSKDVRETICERDKGACIFCEMNYHMERAERYAQQMKSIMHYIPRSANGLGIEQNGAIGCQYHHNMLDNGHDGHRDEMMGLFQKYLESKYQDWDKSKLTYSKWNF